MSYLDWKVGDRVVCIDDRWRREASPLLKGRVYTVAALVESSGVGPDGVLAAGIGVILHEVRNPDKHWTDGGAFLASRFRKVQPRKTSIAEFEAILHRCTEKAPA